MMRIGVKTLRVNKRFHLLLLCDSGICVRARVCEREERETNGHKAITSGLNKEKGQLQQGQEQGVCTTVISVRQND